MVEVVHSRLKYISMVYIAYRSERIGGEAVYTTLQQLNVKNAVRFEQQNKMFEGAIKLRKYINMLYISYRSEITSGEAVHTTLPQSNTKNAVRFGE